jgi:hypothetical protein
MDIPELTLNIEVSELKKIVYTPSEHIRKELLEILKICEIPEEKASLIEYALKEYIRHIIKREGLPEEEWFINALYNIYIHITYVMNTVFERCLFNADLSV